MKGNFPAFHFTDEFYKGKEPTSASGSRGANCDNASL